MLWHKVSKFSPFSFKLSKLLRGETLNTCHLKHSSQMSEKEICLFDVDGTVTLPRQNIRPEIRSFLAELRKKVPIGLVGGSNLEKISEQMEAGLECIKAYDYVFAENGLVAYKNGKLIGKQSILEYMGEEKLQTFINFCLEYMSKLRLPAKRGNFIEFRSGLINVCPVGRSCSQQEREDFNAYDNIHKIRENFIKAIKDKFPDLGLIYSIGGQISFDCFPVGWDKTYCLKYIQADGFTKIHFFGDKTFEGGNDYEIFSHKDIVGHTVTDPEDTMHHVKKMFFS